VGVIEDDLDRVHALRGSPGDGATATDELGELCAQRGVQVLDKPRGDAATFARRQSQPRVLPDDELDATAEHLAITADMRPAVGASRSVDAARRPTGWHVGCELRDRLRHGSLLAHGQSPSQQPDFRQTSTNGTSLMAPPSPSGRRPGRPPTPVDANASNAARLGAEIRARRERHG
jgi:hypothetical protein